jgi:hypothetical protein
VFKLFLLGALAATKELGVKTSVEKGMLGVVILTGKKGHHKMEIGKEQSAGKQKVLRLVSHNPL